MADVNDMDLMRRYADGNSDAAFGEMVGRYINFVYSAALRYVRDPQDAQDVAQAVFIILARKIPALRHRATLTGWLYETTRFAARQLLRTKARRQAREQEAYMESIIQQSEPDTIWQQLEPALEDAMARLSAQDRTLLALRFFENKSVTETASLLGLEEWAVRKRAERSVEKLRTFFHKRGIAVPASVLTSTLSANSVLAAPPGLAKTISSVAIAKGAAASTSTLTLVKGAMKLMAWTKAKSIMVAAVAAILVAGTTGVTVKAVKYYTTPPVESYFKSLTTKALDAAPPLLVLRPSRYANSGDYAIGGSNYGPDGRVMLRGATFTEVLSIAYQTGIQQMVLPPNLPLGRFDLLLALPQNPRQALQAEIKKQFGLVGRVETQDTDVQILKTSQTAAPGLKISRRPGPQINLGEGRVRLRGYKMSDSSGYDLVHLLASMCNQPVVDETGLTNAYDIDLVWDSGLSGDALLQAFRTKMHDQLGLDLVPASRPMQMLVVEKEN